MTWTGKKLEKAGKRPGHLAASVKRNADQDALIADAFEEQEPTKKKSKASGFGNFSGW
jgi:hypothetical protein